MARFTKARLPDRRVNAIYDTRIAELWRQGLTASAIHRELAKEGAEVGLRLVFDRVNALRRKDGEGSP